MAKQYSIVEYYAEHEGYKCGYCKSPNTNFSHGEREDIQTWREEREREHTLPYFISDMFMPL